MADPFAEASAILRAEAMPFHVWKAERAAEAAARDAFHAGGIAAAMKRAAEHDAAGRASEARGLEAAARRMEAERRATLARRVRRAVLEACGRSRHARLARREA